MSFLSNACVNHRSVSSHYDLSNRPYEAKVVGITDGDTITVLSDKMPIKIRLYGVDCPEKRQPFGTKAKQFTSDYVFGKSVTVKPTGKSHRGRIIASIYLDDGRDLAALILDAGLGWWSRRYAPNRADYEQLEKAARKEARGLWLQADPIEPWQFRKHPQNKQKEQN